MFQKCLINWEEKKMKYVCDICGWVYEEEEGAPEIGIAPGTSFDDLSEDFLCPLCNVGKDFFCLFSFFLSLNGLLF